MRLLCSTEFALALFGALTLLAIPGTFGAQRWLYRSPLYVALLALLGASTLACTLRRRRSLAPAVVVVHTGVLVILLGALLGTRGFVATVNVYEGVGVDRFYRADLGRDVPLGFLLTVGKIHRESYPVPVQVGVLKGGEKMALQTLHTSGSFSLDRYRVRVNELDVAEQRLHLTVLDGNRVVGNIDTADDGTLPPAFPYAFRLVAYKNPVVKRFWADLHLSREGREVAAGDAEVNNPFDWEGLSFFTTQIDSDREGRPYAGIQIVRDPGRPVVFAGMALIAIGTIAAWFRRRRGPAAQTSRGSWGKTRSP